MIKFEEHDGMLFEMLDKPVPLTKDAKFPCLVRLIQDDSPMGRLNKRNYDETLNAIECINGYNKMLKLWFYNMIFAIEKFEIIGYPVAEGSKEWALYQMVQGETVTFLDYPNRTLKLVNGYIQDSLSDGFWNRKSGNEFLSYASSTGWQIYKEPKPLLAEAKVGDLVKLRNGSYSQIVEVKDGSVFKYQNPEVISSVAIFLCDENGDTSRWGKVKDVDIIHTEPLAPEGSKDWAWQMMLLGKIIIHSEYRHENATWKMNNGIARSCLAGMSACSKEQWVANAIDNGWQIYEKPNPEPQYKVGDWVEHKESKEQATIRHIMSDGAIEIEFAYSTESDIYQANDFYNDFRKLSPSEIIVKIGCLNGIIAKSCDPNYFLMIHSRPMTDCNHSMIRFSALDTQTRSLVESLLRAMRGES